jgi:hypothetical protein
VCDYCHFICCYHSKNANSCVTGNVCGMSVFSENSAADFLRPAFVTDTFIVSERIFHCLQFLQ